MGNLITSAQSESVDIGVWDMITYLVKRYIVSKVENDEFLCQYLLNNNQTISMLQYSQRAITFDPLPSRITYRSRSDNSLSEYDTPPKYDTSPKYNTPPQIVEYISEESSEDSEEYESEEPKIDRELSLYSAYYDAISQKQRV